jgi:hypothetical protein
MSWIISTRQYIPTIIGEAFGGGYFAGYISHTADGNPTHALIVASRQQIGGKYAVSGTEYTGSTTNYAWALNTGGTPSPHNTLITNGVSAGQVLTDYNARKDFDGAVNISVMKINTFGLSSATYPAAYFIDNINASGGFNGYTDWYLPSRYELDIAYFNLKPGTAVNNLSWGTNIYAVPRRNSNNTTTVPPQTTVTSFTTTAEGFSPNNHWSSTENSATTPFLLTFGSGGQDALAGKTSGQAVRAFRKIALPQL